MKIIINIYYDKTMDINISIFKKLLLMNENKKKDELVVDKNVIKYLIDKYEIKTIRKKYKRSIYENI